MNALTLRGIDGELEQILRAKAEKSGASMNATILQILTDVFKITKKRYCTEHHDLDHLAGTWSKQDKLSFDKNVEAFSSVDKDMWK